MFSGSNIDHRLYKWENGRWEPVPGAIDDFESMKKELAELKKFILLSTNIQFRRLTEEELKFVEDVFRKYKFNYQMEANELNP